VYINISNRMVAAALISLMFLVGISMLANGQQPPQQQASQRVVPDHIPQQPQHQLTPYRQHGDQGQRTKPRNASLKKSCSLILKSLGGHIKPLPSAPADMSSWQNRW
jgi:hypothetical protein